ncbi:MAG: PAS domain-containing protein, partial [Usitatibacter sp.]
MSTMADPLAAPAKPLPRSPLIVDADDATWRSLFVLCAYRVVLALLVAVASVYLNRFFNFGIVTPTAVMPTVISYTIASLILLVPARLRKPSLTPQVTAGILVDVVAIVMLMYASGGVKSGFGVILLVSLAAAGLITRGRLAFFHAAIATLAILLEQTFQVWRYDAGMQDFVQTGITSAAFFATAGLASTLAGYARTSAAIAEERKIDLANLSQINELVIRDMQDGILVVDGDGRIRQTNPRATQLLGSLPAGRWPSISEYAPEIAGLLEAWRRGSETTFMQLRAPRVAGELQVHFVPIGAGDPAPTVIFVEDVGRMRQQAQQMK